METIDLPAVDGHQFQAYRCGSQADSKGSILLIQEIFGVNSHIRGFNCEQRGSCHAERAALAKQKTLEFIHSSLNI